MEDTTTKSLTLPQIARALGVTLRVAGRIAEKIPPPGRIGIIRVWPPGSVEVFRSIMQAERVAKFERTLGDL
jgi:hypothetical protein